MSRGYAASMQAAEVALCKAMDHINKASRAPVWPRQTRELSWAATLIEAARKSLNEAKP